MIVNVLAGHFVPFQLRSEQYAFPIELWQQVPACRFSSAAACLTQTVTTSTLARLRSYLLHRVKQTND